MSALTTPRGPLPARVYWFRRGLLLTVVLLLVFATGRLLSGSGDGESAEGAMTVSAQRTAVDTGEEDGGTATPSATPSAEPERKKKAKKKAPEPLPEPEGVCANEDVVITPALGRKRTGPQVQIDLVLRSKDAAACTWEVSPATVTVKIDSGSRDRPDDIWQSRHCPQTIPTKDVVVYKKTDTVVPITWNGRRSDSDCSEQTDWAKLGWYHVRAAAYAGEPSDLHFELTRPSPVTVTKTVEPEPQKNKKNKNKKKNRASDAPRPTRTPKPSGAVEPDL